MEAKNMKESGFQAQISDKAKEFKFGQMVQGIKDNL